MIFYPDKFLKKSLPKSFFDKDLLAKKNLSLKKNAMQALLLATNASKREINSTVIKVSELYRRKIDDLRDEGLPKAKASVLATNGEKLLRQRIESLVIYAEIQQIKQDNEGEQYEWLPSSSENPDPQHQLLYGKTFLIGEGDDEGNMPGERYGCNCGMRIFNSKK